MSMENLMTCLVKAVFQRTEVFWLWVKSSYIRLLTQLNNMQLTLMTINVYFKVNNYMMITDVNISTLLHYFYFYFMVFIITLSEILAEIMLLKYTNWNKDMIDWLIDWLIINWLWDLPFKYILNLQEVLRLIVF